MYGYNWLFCARVDGLEGLAVDTFDELVVDEPRGCSQFSSSKDKLSEDSEGDLQASGLLV